MDAGSELQVQQFVDGDKKQRVTDAGQQAISDAGVQQAEAPPPKKPAGSVERITHQGRVFVVGDVVVNEAGRRGIQSNGILFSGFYKETDQTHIFIDQKGRLGYEESYDTPLDPFRWARLKDIVNQGEVDIIYTPGGGIKFQQLVEDVWKPKSGNLSAMGDPAGGLTLARTETVEKTRRLKEQAGSTVFLASPVVGRDQIYYVNESGSGPTGNALAHEFFGHLWLMRQNVPWTHPPTPEEFDADPNTKNLPATSQQRKNMVLQTLLFGTLKAEHRILDPFDRIFEGYVGDYIKWFAASTVTKLPSPTFRVSDTHLDRNLEELHTVVSRPDSIRLVDKTVIFSEGLMKAWAYVGNNYEVLSHTAKSKRSHSVSKDWSEKRRKGVVAAIVKWFNTEFSAEKKPLFRRFVNETLQSATHSLPRELSIDVQKEIGIK